MLITSNSLILDMLNHKPLTLQETVKNVLAAKCSRITSHRTDVSRKHCCKKHGAAIVSRVSVRLYLCPSVCSALDVSK